MLLDMAQVRGVVDTSFAWHEEPLPDDPNRKFEFDVGGNFLRSFLAAGLHPAQMPVGFRKKYRHWGSLSWKKPSNSGFAPKARTRQMGKAALVRALLWRERMIDRDLRRRCLVKKPINLPGTQ